MVLSKETGSGVPDIVHTEGSISDAVLKMCSRIWVEVDIQTQFFIVRESGFAVMPPLLKTERGEG